MKVQIFIFGSLEVVVVCSQQEPFYIDIYICPRNVRCVLCFMLLNGPVTSFIFDFPFCCYNPYIPSHVCLVLPVLSFIKSTNKQSISTFTFLMRFQLSNEFPVIWLDREIWSAKNMLQTCDEFTWPYFCFNYALSD